MQDHDAIPHNTEQCNHGAVPHDAMPKKSDCEFFADLIYFTLKFSKKVNYSHFHGHVWVCLDDRSTAIAMQYYVCGVYLHWILDTSWAYSIGCHVIP
jgi:hypothetical protein